VIAGIKSLERLEIGEADFSVKALAGLAKAPSLKQVKVYNTFLKESDIEALKKQLPDIKVIFEPQTDDQRKKLETYLK